MKNERAVKSRRRHQLVVEHIGLMWARRGHQELLASPESLQQRLLRQRDADKLQEACPMLRMRVSQGNLLGHRASQSSAVLREIAAGSGVPQPPGDAHKSRFVTKAATSVNSTRPAVGFATILEPVCRALGSSIGHGRSNCGGDGPTALAFR